MTLALHRLPASHFNALASGSGDFAGELAAGQLSKRVLQILAVLNKSSAMGVDSYVVEQFAESYSLVAAIRRRSRAAVDAVLGYPQVGAWAAQVLRRLVSHRTGESSLDDDLGHFGAIAAAAALTAGEGFELTLRIRADGTLMLPMFGLARLGAGPAWCRAWAGSGTGNISVDVEGALVEVPVHSAGSSPLWWPLRRLSSTVDGRRVDVILDDVDPYRDCHRLGAARRLPAAEVTGWQAGLDGAWTLLTRLHRDRAASLSTGLATLVPLQPNERAPAQSSASTSDACGLVALTPPADGHTLALALVHEYQHSKLSALLDLVTLHNADGDSLFYAPWRPDPRPLGGLFQGAYAYLGLVDYWQVQRLADAGQQTRLANFEFARWLDAIRRALQAIGGSGRLTGAGRRFIAGMRGRLAELRALAVPRELRLLARDALIDHWTCWRLHNLRPDQHQVAGWADAWLAGAPCPPILPRPAVILAGRRWSGTNPRLELTDRRLRDPAGFDALCNDRVRLASEIPGAGPADTAYAQADYPAAAGLYRDLLAASPDRVDAWAGLVLAHRRLRTPAARFLVSYPESVLALQQRIVATAGMRPGAWPLVRWLDRAHRAALDGRAEPSEDGNRRASAADGG
jgi:HEXXH motif-containing protein